MTAEQTAEQTADEVAASQGRGRPAADPCGGGSDREHTLTAIKWCELYYYGSGGMG